MSEQSITVLEKAFMLSIVIDSYHKNQIAWQLLTYNWANIKYNSDKFFQGTFESSPL